MRIAEQADKIKTKFPEGRALMPISKLDEHVHYI